MTDTENKMSNMPTNFVFGDPSVESDIDFGSFNTITDNELFKYFLNEDLVDTTDQILSSPTSSLDSAPNSSDSPQPSPPQLSPERPEFGAPLVSIPAIPSFNISNAPPALQVKIKEEVTDSNISSCSLPAMDESKLRVLPSSSKKRSAPKDAEATNLLSREELLKLSAKGTTDSRQASPEAEKQLKRQKRLIKNRESAQLSRLRKKLYIEELERKVTHLTTDNDTLSKQVNALSSDKKRLQEEVIYLQNIIKQSPELTAALATRKPGLQPKNLKAAGVCLLVILFSVGLIFNQSRSSLPFTRSSREEIPEVVPKSTGRVLKSVPEVEELTEPTLPSPSGKSTPIVVEESEVTALAPLKSKELKDRKHKRVLAEEEEEEVEEDQRIVVSSKSHKKEIEPSKKKRMKIAEESMGVEDVSNKALVPAETVVRPEKQNTEIVPRINPNANYFYCPEAHYVSPATASSEGPEIVALLLPASVLNGTLRGDHPNLDSSLLEISCQVLKYG